MLRATENPLVNINPQQPKQRQILWTYGPLVFLTGAALMLLVMVDYFFSALAFRPPNYFWCFFLAMPMFLVGLGMTFVGFMNKLARRYSGDKAAPASGPAPPFETGLRWFNLFFALVMAGVVAYLFVCYLFFVADRVAGMVPETKYTRQAEKLAAVLNAYADDHDGKYPDGASSTEAFQKLVDAGYLTLPAAGQLLYLPMPGKNKYEFDLTITDYLSGKQPPPSHRLKAENVCFDLIAPMTVDAARQVPSAPLVISTGYRLSFEPGAKPEVLEPEQVQALKYGILIRVPDDVVLFQPGEEISIMPGNIPAREGPWRQLRP